MGVGGFDSQLCIPAVCVIALLLLVVLTVEVSRPLGGCFFFFILLLLFFSILTVTRWSHCSCVIVSSVKSRARVHSLPRATRCVFMQLASIFGTLGQQFMNGQSSCWAKSVLNFNLRHTGGQGHLQMR